VVDDTVVQALRFLSKGRREYYQGPPIETMQDMENLPAMQLILLIEYETAEKLARIIEDPDSAWGWLPVHQLDAWQPYADALKLRSVGDVQPG
jgi:hypothetical protein